jgi:hypothetical protein
MFLAISGFPQTIVPNPLISEMSALAARAGLSVPLVEEVAADIFTGTFTAKWADAAAAASSLLDGTLYARYYDLPAPQAWAGPPGRITAKVTKRWGKTTAEDFAAVCASRARQAHISGGSGSRVAVNGTVLEQSQVLTTHNLAILIDALGLRDRVADLAPDLAGRALPGSSASCSSASPPTGPSSRRSRTRPMPGGRPCTSSACARSTRTPRRWPGCATRSRLPVRTSKPGSALPSTGWRTSSQAARLTSPASRRTRAVATGSWAGPSARTGSSPRTHPATPRGGLPAHRQPAPEEPRGENDIPGCCQSPASISASRSRTRSRTRDEGRISGLGGAKIAPFGEPVQDGNAWPRSP